MKFNINNCVKVTLTEHGVKTYQEHWKQFGIEKRVVVGEVLKMQMWNMIQTFGPEIYLGNHMPFETEIEICE